jgi:hypothetical protein
MIFKKGERVEILSVDQNNGNYMVFSYGKRGYIKRNYIQLDVN